MRDEDGRQQLLDVLSRAQHEPRTDEARLTYLEDRAALHDIVMRYAFFCDLRAWEDVISLCTDDVVRVLGGSIQGSVKGKDELLQRLRTPYLPLKEPSSSGEVDALRPSGIESRHLMCTDVAWIAEDRSAAAMVLHYALPVTRDGAQGFERGVHEGSDVFEFRRLDDGWRISRFTIYANTAHNPVLAGQG